MHEAGGLTRFANSEIHQSIAREDTGLRVRVVKGGHVGVAASNEATPEGAAAAASSALEMAEIVAADPQWPGLAPAAPRPEVDRYFERTANATPEMRAEAVGELIGRAARPDAGPPAPTRRSRWSWRSPTARASSVGLRRPRPRSPRW